MKTEAKGAGVESTAEGDFRARVLAPDARHHAGPGRGINNVNQAYPLARLRRPGKADT